MRHCFVSLAIAIVLSGTAHATLVRESFEDVAGPFQPIVTVQNGETFPSGLRYLFGAASQPTVQDTASGLTDCHGRSPISPVPHGTAAICLESHSGNDTAWFAFPVPVGRVELRAAHSSGSGIFRIRIEAFDQGGATIDSDVIDGAGFDSWSSNVLSLQAEGIAGFRIWPDPGAGGLLVDDIRFDSCGGGEVDFGEECDDGARNGTGESCCNRFCQFDPPGDPCTDDNFCTEIDACDGAGTCLPGEQRVCEARHDCREPGTCDPETGQCSDPVSPDGKPCDDGSACTSNDACQSGSCQGDDVVTSPITDPEQLLECVDEVTRGIL